MTKPRMVLASLVVLLGTAGAFASKVTHKLQPVYYTNGSNTCSTLNVNKACSTGNTGCTTTIGDIEHAQLFQTVNMSDQCINPLKVGS